VLLGWFAVLKLGGKGGWFLLGGSVGALLGQLFWAVDMVVDSLGGVDWWSEYFQVYDSWWWRSQEVFNFLSYSLMGSRAPGGDSG
jgi:hypothetical protein